MWPSLYPPRSLRERARFPSSLAHAFTHSSSLTEQVPGAWGWPRAHSQMGVPGGQQAELQNPDRQRVPRRRRRGAGHRRRRTQAGRGQHTHLWILEGKKGVSWKPPTCGCLQSLADICRTEGLSLGAAAWLVQGPPRLPPTLLPRALFFPQAVPLELPAARRGPED